MAHNSTCLFLEVMKSFIFEILEVLCVKKRSFESKSQQETEKTL